jgi:DNA-binding NarL/FixJ family response regulator
VFECIGRGLGASEIARKLHLSVKTIESYQAKLKEKLNLKDSSALFQYALHWVERR